jgi:hypothetical protein
VRLAVTGEPCMLLDLCTRSSDLLHMLESRYDHLCVLTAMQCHCFLPAGQLQAYQGDERRLAIAFAPHPRQLLLGVGTSLLRCSIGAPGQHKPEVAVLHTSVDGSSFMALATVEQVSSLSDTLALILSMFGHKYAQS